MTELDTSLDHLIDEASKESSAERRSGLSYPLRLVIAAILGLVIIGVDQVTKSYAIEHLKDRPAQSYLGGTLLLVYAENPGAFGSIFSGLSDEVRWYVLTLGSAVLLLSVVVYVLVNKDIDSVSFFALAFIVAGGLGNLIDRMQYGTIVIDFLYMQAGPLHTNVFNVADVSIVVGFLLLVVPMLNELIRPGAAPPTNPTQS